MTSDHSYSELNIRVWKFSSLLVFSITEFHISWWIYIIYCGRMFVQQILLASLKWQIMRFKTNIPKHDQHWWFASEINIQLSFWYFKLYDTLFPGRFILKTEGTGRLRCTVRHGMRQTSVLQSSCDCWFSI